jgi:hypothetical protein
MDFYKPVADLLLNRYPIKVKILSQSLIRPIVVVQIINQTPLLTVVVHEVRVHYGNADFSRYFGLYPQSKQSLLPKDKLEWKLSTKPFEWVLGERAKQRVMPINSDPMALPGIESPAQLFNAIGMGNARDSWIEVDFNEYENRKFLRGKIKRIFDLVGRECSELRKKNDASRNST